MHDYEQLRVWQAARRLVVDVYTLSRAFPDDERFGLTAQMRRSAISVPSNIAEGAGRSGRSFGQFLHYAAGSAAELQTQLELSIDLGFADPDTVGNAVDKVQAVRMMLWKLIDAQT